MAKTFECKNVGVVCNFRTSGETDDEVMQKLAEHGRRVHGVDLTQSRTLQRYARSAIRDDSGR